MIERLARNPLLLGAAFFVSALLGAGLFALIQAMVPGANPDKARVEAVVHDYILNHGELLPEAMERLQERQVTSVIATNRAGIFDAYSGAVQGNPKGDVTVAAYLDYNCGYCRASLPAIAELVARDPNVRIVYREFPVLGPDSIVAARWALAAAEQGKFLPFHKAVYAEGRADAAALARAAAAAGLDTKLAGQAINAPRIQHEIDKNLKVAQLLGTNGGTPFWVVGDRVVAGMVDYDRLSAAVAAARAAE